MTAAAPFDLAIIGGGINGAGIARDTAGRGLRVALIERDDLASGTSSASTKLIHGGLRYLEHYEFALVREALVERERLWAIAPHIIWPMRFVLPHNPAVRPAWLVRAGLFLYDHIGGRKRLPATRTLDLTRDAAGAALQPRFRRAFEYSDCWVDDARMVVLNARDAADRGASVMTRTAVTALMRDKAGLWQLTLTAAGGQTRDIAARAVVNAAGPGVLSLLDTASLPHARALRQVRGSHIVVPRLFDHDRAYFFQNADGRILFAIPYEDDFTLIGTTDADHDGPLTNVQPSAAEVAYLCDAASRYFAAPVAVDQVVWRYAGVRPLVDDGSNRPEAATRGYSFALDTAAGNGAPILSVFGGKLTTYRQLAESGLAQLAPWFPALAAPGWTATQPLPGGDFAIDDLPALHRDFARDFGWLDTATRARLLRQYGTCARRWLGDATSSGDLGQHFGHGLFAAEVDWLIAREWAMTAEDVLWRRTKLGLRLGPDQVTALADYMAKGTACRVAEPNVSSGA